MITVGENIRNQILSDDHHMAIWVHWLGANDKTISDLTNMDIVDQSLVLRESISRNRFKLGCADVSACEFDLIIDDKFPFSKADLTGKRFELYLVCKNYADGEPVYYDTGTGDTAFCDFNKNNGNITAREGGTVETYLQLKYGSTTVTTASRFSEYEAGERIRDNRFFFPRTDDNGNMLTQVIQVMAYAHNTSRFNMPVTGLTDCTKIPLGIFKVDECELATDKNTRHVTAYDDLYSPYLDREISYGPNEQVTMSDLIYEMSLATGIDFNLSFQDTDLNFRIVEDNIETQQYTFSGMPIEGSCTVQLVKSKIHIDDYNSSYAHVYQWLSDRSLQNARNLLMKIEAAFGFNYVAGISQTDSDTEALVGKYTAWQTAYHSSSLYNLVNAWKSTFRVQPQPDSSSEFTMWRIASASFTGMAYNQIWDEGYMSGIGNTVTEVAHFQNSARIPLYNQATRQLYSNRKTLIYFPSWVPVPDSLDYGDNTLEGISSVGRSLTVEGAYGCTNGRVYTMRTDEGDSRYGVVAYIKLDDLIEAMCENMVMNLYIHGLVKEYDGDRHDAEWWDQDDYTSYIQFENYVRWYYSYSRLASGSGFVSRYETWYYNAHNYGQPMDGVFVQIGGDWAMLINTSYHNGEGWAYDQMDGMQLLSGFKVPHLNSFFEITKTIVLSDNVDPQTGYEYWPPHMELNKVIQRAYTDPFANLQFVTTSNTTFKIRDLIGAYAEIHGAFFRMNRYGEPEFMVVAYPLYPDTALYPSEDLYPSDMDQVISVTERPYPGLDVYPDQELYPADTDEVDYLNGMILKKKTRYRIDTPLIYEGVRLETSEGWLEPVIKDERDNADIYDISNCITRYFVTSSAIRTLICQNVWDSISDIHIDSGDYDFVGMPQMECGDVFYFSEDESVFIFDRKLKGIQSLTDSYTQRID